MADSPREESSPSPRARPQPAASSKKGSLESFGARSDTTVRSRTFSQQESSGHVAASFTSKLPSSVLHSQSTFSSKDGLLRVKALSRRSVASENEATPQQRSPELVHGGTLLGDDSASPPEGPSEEGGAAGRARSRTPSLTSPEARTAPPSRAAAVRRSVAEVFAADSERRAAALASRRSSRAISRAEGSADPRNFAQRADVAVAAAEQLRKMEASSSGQATGARNAPFVKVSPITSKALKRTPAQHRDSSTC